MCIDQSVLEASCGTQDIYAERRVSSSLAENSEKTACAMCQSCDLNDITFDMNMEIVIDIK